jgi:hypothetical protein
VAQEAHAEHVEGFALVPVGDAPDRFNRRKRGCLTGQETFQRIPMLTLLE